MKLSTAGLLLLLAGATMTFFAVPGSQGKDVAHANILLPAER